ncbi:MAG: hypothetical protein LBC59_10000 [Chitinispirillales bacterium]|jgi:hypothetical protein|nr:hypothetical protein [Chitinispirillales bacterium]
MNSRHLSKLVLSLLLAAVTAFISFGCDSDADNDGDGEFSMSGKNSNGSYEYELRNRSDYQVTVTVGRYHNKTLTRNSVDIFFNSSEKLTIKYAPSDKVKPTGSISPVYFNNR